MGSPGNQKIPANFPKPGGAEPAGEEVLPYRRQNGTMLGLTFVESMEGKHVQSPASMLIALRPNECRGAEFIPFRE
jgi:hypothetical protein